MSILGNYKLPSWINEWRTGKYDNVLKPGQLTEIFKILTNVKKSLSAPKPTPNQPIRIVLNTIMRNEHPVMRRCIESALPIIDALSYSDTGSREDVFPLLRSIVPAHIPLDIEIEQWKDFGHNRTLGLQQTCRFIQRLGWDLDQTYILVLDADMTLTIQNSFMDEKQKLTADFYSLSQQNEHNFYWNFRLMRASKDWKVVGRTHEYYQANKAPAVHDRIYSLTIADRNDGMNRSDKLTRDIKLLLLDVQENPRNSRSYFYLGETFRARGNSGENDYSNAIECYRKHIEVGSWEEEVWYSCFAIGLCQLLNKNDTAAIESLHAAAHIRPSRIEPLYMIAKYHRDKNEHHTALYYFKNIVDAPFPKDDILFVNSEIYKIWRYAEMGISACHVNDKKTGNQMYQYLLRTSNIPDHARIVARMNMRLVIGPLLATLSFSRLVPNLLDGYFPCNPSLCIQDDKLLILCRGVNYTQRNARNYKATDGTDIFQTQNVLITCNFNSTGDVEFESEVPVKNELLGPHHSTCKVRGQEDCRIFAHGDKLRFSFTSLEHNPSNTPVICCGTLGVDANVINVMRLHGHHDELMQKNWLPFTAEDGTPWFVYGYYPKLTLLRADGDVVSVALQKDWSATCDVDTRDWRGSSGPVLIPKVGYLLLIHEVCDTQEGRTYTHRFLLTDLQWNLHGVSNLFYLKNPSGVEMATGMVLRDDQLYVSFGVEDCEAYLTKMPLRFVLAQISSVARTAK